MLVCFDDIISKIRNKRGYWTMGKLRLSFKGRDQLKREWSQRINIVLPLIQSSKNCFHVHDSTLGYSITTRQWLPWHFCKIPDLQWQIILWYVSRKVENFPVLHWITKDTDMSCSSVLEKIDIPIFRIRCA